MRQNFISYMFRVSTTQLNNYYMAALGFGFFFLLLEFANDMNVFDIFNNIFHCCLKLTCCFTLNHSKNRLALSPVQFGTSCVSLSNFAQCCELCPFFSPSVLLLSSVVCVRTGTTWHVICTLALRRAQINNVLSLSPLFLCSESRHFHRRKSGRKLIVGKGVHAVVASVLTQPRDSHARRVRAGSSVSDAMLSL